MSNNIFINEGNFGTDLYSKLFEERIIFLTGIIQEDNANLIKSQLLYLDQLSEDDPIKIYIDSPGGDVYTGLGIVDIMEYIKSPVETVNIGLAASMAAVILCCGDKRKALPHSRTMIHQPMGGDWGQSSDVEITAKELTSVKKELYKLISKKTGKSESEVELNADRDYWMTAKEAKKYGLIDEIIKSKK